MADRYYVEKDEESTYPDSESPHFYCDNPFDTLDEAKQWAADNPSSSYGAATIYHCHENILTPVLYRGYGDILWQDYDRVVWSR